MDLSLNKRPILRLWILEFKVNIATPYYLIDEQALLHNMQIIDEIRSKSGAKFVLALKCFACHGVFDLMRKYMDGTTSSSLYEARLGYEKFGGQTHAFSTAYSESDIANLSNISDKIIFNSISQLTRYGSFVRQKSKADIGLRINPLISYSHFDLADPARLYSRLGARDINAIYDVLDKIDGAMFHYNCENGDFQAFKTMLETISNNYKRVLEKVKWVSLGGGVYFTKENYPVDDFSAVLKNFADKFNVEVYLEPGEAAITNSAKLITTVLDIVENEKKTAIVDASIEAHMLDLLVYRESAKLDEAQGENEYIIAGKSCLAGDIFGEYKIERQIKVGDMIQFKDAAGYTMVKKNWFNGLNMPSIVIKRLNGKIEILREFAYEDFVSSLS
jgi:carboxynorspermidine decarboxylase